MKPVLKRLWPLLLLALPLGAAQAQVPSAPPATLAPAAAPSPAPAQAPAEPPAAAPVQAAPPAHSPPPPSVRETLEPLLQPIQRLGAAIETAEKAVERVKDRDEALAQQRTEIDEIFDKAGAAGEALKPRMAATRSQLERLGAEPAKGQPPEAPGIAGERARLNAILAELDGAVRTTKLIEVRARQLTARVQDLRRQIFTRNLLNRGESPLRPGIWRQVANELPGSLGQLRFIGADWWSRASQSTGPLGLLLAAAILVPLGLGVLGDYLRRRNLPAAPPSPPSFFDRSSAAGLSALLMAAPAVAAMLILYGGLDALDLLYLQSRDIADSALQAGLTFTGVCALARAILAPSRPAWRLVELSDQSARRLLLASQAIAGVHAGDLLLNDLVRTLFLPLNVNVAIAFLASLAVALLLVAIVRTPFAPLVAAPDEPPPSRFAPHWLKLPLLVVAAAIVVTSLTGYIALGRFIASQVIITTIAVVVVTLLHLAIQAIEDTPADRQSRVGDMLERRIGLDPTQRGQIVRLVTLLLNAALALVAAPLVLLSWGFSLPEILGWLNAAVFGFEVGQFKISLARILIAAVLFLALLFITRFIQRWLSATVLTPARMDQGLAHSIHTGVGYAGFALAALTGLAYTGLDITNLAIVAGALSVGIGFGLQSIVNNFVSGLILLVERPVKVGDLIIVGGKEGYVRRISVRATEIETFDKASVIVPNSELITSAVTNWTHRNALGRVVIRMSVTPDADPDRVRDILLEVAKGCELVLAHPPAFVVFDNFGDNGHEYSLRIHVADVNTSLKAQTELRTGIVRAFREAGIAMPNPQRDIHLRDLDGLKQAFAQLLDERRRAREEGGTPTRPS